MSEYVRVDAAHVLARFEQGATVEEILAETGASTGQLKAILNHRMPPGPAPAPPPRVVLERPELIQWTEDEVVAFLEARAIPLAVIGRGESCPNGIRNEVRRKAWLRTRVRELYAAGVYTRAISARLDISLNTISEWTRDLARHVRQPKPKPKPAQGPVAPRRPRGRKPREFSAEQIQAAREAWERGWTARQIARAVGLTFDAVRGACKDLPRRKSGPKPRT